LNIGVAVDGVSEVTALPRLRDAIEAATSNRFMSPIRLRTTPLAPVQALAAECARAARTMRTRGADLVLVLIDRETREDCPPAIAEQLSAAIDRRGAAEVVIRVVVKDRTFENWLIADPAAIEGLQGRFSPTGVAAIKAAVAGGRADERDALQLLERATVNRSYQKVKDSDQILSRVDLRAMSRNSRSFRCFLRRVGHPDYQRGSRRPAPE
jgi:hypothetical protein